MAEILLIYFLISVLASASFYISGGIILNILKIKFDNIFLKVFSNLLCGIIAAVFIYSIAITNGNTVMTGVLIPISFILSSLIKQNNKREKLFESLYINTKTILLCIALLFLICSYNLFFVWDINHHVLVSPWHDQVFYARVSDYLNFRGIESSYLDYFNANNPSPYHYFELWLTALIARFPGLNTLLIQQISINSIFFLTLYFGGLAIVNSVKKVTILDVIICLFLPFFEGLRIPFFPKTWYHHNDYFFFDNPFLRQKLYEISILFIASFLLFLRQRKDLALLILLITCFVNISFLTSIPFVIIILCLFFKFDHKFKVIFASILTLIFCYLFYSLNKTTAMWKDSPSILSMIEYTFSSFAIFKIAFDNTAKTFLEFMLIFFPFLFAIFFLWKKDRTYLNILKPMTAFVIITVLLSAILWSFFTIKSNSIQLFTNISIPLVNTYFFILSILFISRMNSMKSYLIYLAFGVWGVLCIMDSHRNLMEDKTRSENEYSLEYIQQVKQKIMTLNNQGGHLSAFEGTYDNMGIIFAVNSYKTFLAFIKNNINITLLQSTDNITQWDDPIFRPQEKVFEKMQFFNRYLEQQKSLHKFVSEEQSRMDYIKENNLQYVFADKGAVVDYLLLSITDTIITDKISGERFLILKK